VSTLAMVGGLPPVIPLRQPVGLPPPLAGEDR
jgi:hypothetical protein